MGEINKTISVSKNVTVTADLKWIPGDAATEPATPAGYGRDASLDISLGDLGKLWAFVKVA